MASDKRRKLSFWSTMQNAFPQFAPDRKVDVDMTPEQMDALLRTQLAGPYPRHLDATSLVVAGVVDNEALGGQVISKLVKHGFVLPCPARNGRLGDAKAAMTVDTRGIDRSFAHKVAIISMYAVRKLVALLFFWEEECNRWRQLDLQERDAEEAIRVLGNAAGDDLRILLEAVRMKKRLLPSERVGEGGGNVGRAVEREHVLPSYA